eukprot:CAMPEP_0119277934 /NCGR_PEP_ID=MMETSP1329-20130426/18181_1 /TAXON_ID=114041 /ORGANISM="Genus nov. species nov., Strain RCC1024" /LENGTH=232 /DNA_ID=CAMNT_0007278429 /DNA_START=54 /DNA_END=749 /DNA_ORIENTATION=+
MPRLALVLFSLRLCAGINLARKPSRKGKRTPEPLVRARKLVDDAREALGAYTAPDGRPRQTPGGTASPRALAREWRRSLERTLEHAGVATTVERGLDAHSTAVEALVGQGSVAVKGLASDASALVRTLDTRGKAKAKRLKMGIDGAVDDLRTDATALIEDMNATALHIVSGLNETALELADATNNILDATSLVRGLNETARELAADAIDAVDELEADAKTLMDGFRGPPPPP